MAPRQADDLKGRWQELYNRCDPEEPATDDRLRAPRTHSPYGEIIEWLGAPGQPPKILVTGIMGAGKSTELVRVARARTSDDFVLHLDLSRAFSSVIQDTAALQRVTAWEICFLVGLGVMALAAEEDIVAWDREVQQSLLDAWKAAARDEAPAKVDVVALGRQLLQGAGLVASASGHPLVGAGLGATGKALEGFAIKIGLTNRVDLPAQDEALRHLLAVVNRIIGTVQDRHRRVLIVLDGLDRIETFDRARAVFIDSDLLGRLHAALVATGPFLPHRYLQTANVRAFQRTRLLCEPVIDFGSRGGELKPGPALPFFRDVFHRRAADLGLGGAITESQLDRLAIYSGGRLRQFVKMVRQVALGGWQRGAEAIDDAVVSTVIDRMRLDEEEALSRKMLAVLRGVMDDPGHQLPDDAVELLQTARLLPYPNGSDWFFPNPLLTLQKLR